MTQIMPSAQPLPKPDPREIARLTAEHTRAWNEGRHADAVAIMVRLRQLRGSIVTPQPRRRAFATGFTTW